MRAEISKRRRDMPMDSDPAEPGVARFDANRRPVSTPVEVADARWQAEDEKLDLALQDTFPASDPFSLR